MSMRLSTIDASERRRSFALRRSHAAWPLCAALLLGCLLLACGSDDDGNGNTDPVIRRPQDFLPPGTEDMPKSGDPQVATNTGELQDIVNGGYEVYTNNGFQEMAAQLYDGTVSGTAANVTVWIMDQGSAAGAAALHEDLLQVGAWEEYQGLGNAAHRRTELFSHIMLFRRDEYSAQLTISNSSQDAKDLVVLFATHIDEEIQRSN
jgi:hypothetical protein